MKASEKQFCPKGHDTLVTGRYEGGHCKVCSVLPRKKFCIYGHDISKVGRGAAGHCNGCRKVERKKRRKEMKEYRQDNHEEISKREKEYRKKHKKKYQDYNRKYQQEHRKELLALNKKYRKKHPEIYKIANLKNQTNRNLRIPMFGQEGIKEFYVVCQKRKVVDHIIPLQGRKVSGLHVIWNLQYLTVKENKVKYNQFDGTLKNNSWRIKNKRRVH